MTIYVVSGARRTGTSMMMAALYHGSDNLDLLVAPSMEEANPERNGYRPNPNGLYEVGLVRYLEPRFLRKIPDDCLIKILYDGLPNLYPGDYKIVFMERDEDEIRASEEKVDKHFKECAATVGKAHPDHNEYTQILPFCSLRPYNRSDIDHALAICGQRADIDVMRVNYRDVIENPVKVFTDLQAWGLPLDVEKAASTIDSSLHRVRREECQRPKQGCEETPLVLQ